MNEDVSLEPIVLDVRPVIAAGGDPYEQIVATTEQAGRGQPIVILNSFEPFPLYEALAARGFAHTTERLPDGDWKVTFRRG